MYDITKRLKATLHYEYINRSLRQVSRIHGVSKTSRSQWVHMPPVLLKRDLQRHRSRSLDNSRQLICKMIRNDPYI
jgi:hypothetical protein